jgi:NADH-quinone oxidoreductase subunit N
MAGTSLLGGAILVPLLTLVGTAVGVLLCDLWGTTQRLSAWVSLTSLIVAPVLMLIVVVSGQGGTAQGMLIGDGMAALWALLFCAAGGIAILIGLGRMQDAPSLGSGTYALVLFAVSSALIVAQSAHMLSLAIGLATLHVSLAALSGLRTAWRYLVVHGLGLACFLFGLALLYGATGSMQVDMVAEVLNRQTSASSTNPLAMLSLGLVAGGLLLPLGIVPFHTWLPGLCQRSSLPGGCLMSHLLPGAALAALLRLGCHAASVTYNLTVLLAILGTLSVGLGYVYALRAGLIREALAGIVIARSGTWLLSLLVLRSANWAILFYLLLSSSLNLFCLWAVVACASPEGKWAPVDITGLGSRHPGLALVATLCLLNVVGVPPLAGAVGQLYLVHVAIAAGYGWMVGLTIAGSLLAWLLAGRWMMAMWMHPTPGREPIRVAPEILLVALGAAAGIVWAGLYARTILNWFASLVGG